MNRKILLADDSLTIQKVVELTFMEGNFEVISMSNGDDALSWLADNTPDIVIADVHMPGADGYAICRRTKESDPSVPVMLLVGTFEPFEESSAAECGADAHLKKPFDSQELLRLVESLLSRGSIPSAAEREDLRARESAADFGDQSFGDLDLDDESTEVSPPEEADYWEAATEPYGEKADQPQVSAPERDPKMERSRGAEEVPEAESPAEVTMSLSEHDVERIARKVVEIIGDELVREISWDVIPDLAEIVIKDRIRELESQVE